MSKLAVVFPGQGSQYMGMGRKWYENNLTAKQYFEEASTRLGFDLRKLCLEGDLEELTKTENTQPAILTVSMIAFRLLLEETGAVPYVLAGHSLGEITALTAAGGISFSDAVYLVHHRGKYMQEAVFPGMGAMSAINGLMKDQVEEICFNVSRQCGVVVPSNYNTADQIVISGERDAVSEAEVQLTRMGAIVIPLKVSAPFHSPLMSSASDQLFEHLKSIHFKQLRYPVLSNATGELYKSELEIASMLTKQLTEPVLWTECMKRMEEFGVDVVIEAGPQGVLTHFMKKSMAKQSVFAMDKEELSTIVKSLETKPSSNKATIIKPKTNLVTKCIAITVCTRNRNWDNDEYQKGVVEPYRKVQKIQDELDRTGGEPTIAQMKEALEMLSSVFETKKVPLEERLERYQQVFNETGTRDLFPDFDPIGASVGG
ncbi:[acyl-carrier-protein] S-malonyltransferase [Paenibacillus psychroresistens]|uniref:[acyl-carrier-protein] S-malonyltransferase n=1 Tax=Paenibacillus psychroresistens TaxID=1778678 RepID=A0A6B8RJ97_9BACL|nr:ACP S-malonyltransferase [Paenibacillus psychroresistens]QGQ96119.1 [acyl-carrier-protein] S-malonyltransferase [Paenibacillus psychroresistens]